MIKVCLDTNVFISALLFDRQPEEILFMSERRVIELVVSPAILTELQRVLKEKFQFADTDIKGMLKTITSISTIVIPKVKIKVLGHKPDNRVLETALAGNVDYIVTGDKKHLLPLKRFRGILIVSPKQFLENYGR